MRVTSISPVLFKLDAELRGMMQIMNSLALGVYALSVVVLFLKFFATITVQAVERLRDRRFRYAEDAAFWRGTVGEESDRTVRAQHLLRNDAESQLWYVALGASYLWLGAWPAGAPYYFGIYALSRVAHAYFLLTERQPHRNRAFSLGIAVLFALAGHVAYECVGLHLQAL
jgi:MAPEG family